MRLNLKYLFLFLTIFSVLPVFAGPLDDFVTTWKTDNVGISNSTSITIPTHTAYTYNYDVDWNDDGIFDQFGISGDVTHDFGIAGTYTIRIQGQFPRIIFNINGNLATVNDDCEKILSVDQWGTQVWVSMNKAFLGCVNLNGQASDVPDLSNVTNMSYMFMEAISFNQDIGTWNTSNVQNMSSMFYKCLAFNQDIGSWNTSTVIDMRVMFYGASSFNQDIDFWNIGNVESTISMFSGATSFNQDIGSWNTADVRNMHSMFRMATSFDQDIGSWDIGNLGSIVNSQLFQNWNWSVWGAAEDMFLGVTLSVANYDALLIGWQAQLHLNNIQFHGGYSQYCLGENARNTLVNIVGWNIIDGGLLAPLVNNDILHINVCDSFELQPLATGSYFTQSNGLGTALFTGDYIYSSQTIYIFSTNGVCANETPFQISFSPIYDTIFNTSCSLFDTGLVVQNFISQNSCDSTVTTITSYLPILGATSFISLCYGDSVLINGQNVSFTGYYHDTIYNSFCDSTKLVYLTVSDSISNLTTNIVACDSLLYGGNSYYSNATYIDTFLNSFGCIESVTKVEIEIYDTLFTTIDTAICSSDSIFLQNAWQTLTGTYYDTLLTNNTSVCPHYFITNLTVKNDYFIMINNTSCNPLDTGIIVQYFNALFSCDSIITTHTKLLPSSNDSLYSFSCYPSDTGIMFNSLVNVYGCDSIYTMHIKLSPNSLDTIINTSCNPFDTGTLVQNLMNTFACDSIITIITTLSPSSNDTILLTSCNPLDTGIVVHYLSNIFNCDSIITTITSYNKPNPLFEPLEDKVLCLNDKIIINEDGYDFIWNDGTIGPILEPKESNSFTVTFTQNITDCIITEDFYVTVSYCVDECFVVLPNSFSPFSTMSKNDILKVITNCEKLDFFDLLIADRWGQIIFRTDNPNNGWNGYYKNTQLALGTYVYNVSFIKEGQTEKQFFNGTVSLIK